MSWQRYPYYFFSLKQVFKRLHLGTVSFGTDSMEEVCTLDFSRLVFSYQKSLLVTSCIFASCSLSVMSFHVGSLNFFHSLKGKNAFFNRLLSHGIDAINIRNSGGTTSCRRLVSLQSFEISWLHFYGLKTARHRSIWSTLRISGKAGAKLRARFTACKITFCCRRPTSSLEISP